MCICSICSQEYLKHFITEALELLKKYDWLMDAYILDFFVDQHWSALPKSWQEIFSELSPEAMGEWLDYRQPVRYQQVWPLSLMALRATASHLSIPRQPEPCHLNHLSTSKDETKSHCTHCQFVNMSIQDENRHTNIYSRFIKPKKFHEINRIAKVASSCAERVECQYIVDIGSGLGHLGRLLALRHGLKVCCLEEQATLTNKAKILDEKLIKVLSKKQKNELIPPVHINMSIEAAVECGEFIKLVHRAFDIPDDTLVRFGIVGLHPCGDLGPTLLRLMIDCPGASFINLVGCCYMKLSDDCSLPVKGYPLSNQLLSKDNYFLSYQAREVACHAIETYTQRLRSGCVEELRVHCYRAALENVIMKQWPEFKHSGLKSIKNVENMEFSVYAEQAVEKLGLHLPRHLLDTSETDEQLHQWLRVVAFYSLRLLLAPSVESVLLLDRMLFLQEAGISNVLLPAFDPELSPRNHILIAMKENSV